MTVHKRHQGKYKEEPKEESIVVSDVITETTEKIEVVEEISPEEASSIGKLPSSDPLTKFKEKMIEEEQMPLTPAKKNYIWPILFIFIVALALMAGIFIYKNGMNRSGKINVVSLSPTPTTIPTPTIAVDLSKYEIKILNGSEVDGEAGRQQASLEAEGFTISSIGNASKSDYTKTIIRAKKEVDKAFLDKLKSILESSFVVGDQEELSDDDDSDVIVIIGSETN